MRFLLPQGSQQKSSKVLFISQPPEPPPDLHGHAQSRRSFQFRARLAWGAAQHRTAGCHGHRVVMSDAVHAASSVQPLDQSHAARTL